MSTPTTTNPPSPSPADRVLIIGAGITGLLLAHGLTKNSIPCTIFEAEPSATHYRPREWGMSIQWGLPLLQQLLSEEMFDGIKGVAVDPNYEPEVPGRLPTLNGETGEVLKEIELLRMFRVGRRGFRGWLAQSVDVVYGKVLKGVRYLDENEGGGVEVEFEDGTKVEGAMVVGADGTHSKLRHLVFGDGDGDVEGGKGRADAKLVPYNAINLHVRYGDVEKARFVRKMHPIMYHAIHPRGYWLFVAVQEVPDPEDPTTWVFQLQTTWKKGTVGDPCTVPGGEGEDEGVDSLEKHWKRAEMMGEPFRSANLWIPEGTKLSVNKMAYWVPERWDCRGGRVALIGDAIHCMTFHRGQGLNHGIADAANLTTLLKEVKDGVKGREEAVKEYMEEMVPRAGDEVKMGLMNTEMLHDWKRFQQSPLFQKGGHASSVNKVALEEQRHK